MSGWTEQDLAARNRELGIIPCGHPVTKDGACGIPWCEHRSDPVLSLDVPLAADLMPEWMIEAECTRLLEQDGWRALRTDPVSDRGRGKGFGELGMADHLYMRYSARHCADFANESHRAQSETLWIEFKSAKGKPQSHQIEWHTKERARGALTWLAGVDFPASVAGFVEHYRKSVLNRGRV